MTTPTSRRRLSRLGLFTLTVTMLGPFTAADAATFVVNSTADHVDVNPGDGVCDNGAGACTLRAAIIEANYLSGADVILFGFTSATTFPLALWGSYEEASWTGDLDITDPLEIVTISINGIAPIMTIDASKLQDRVFDVHPGVSVAMSNLIIQKGLLGDGGGGLRNQGYLELSNVVVRFNTSDSRGGGILNTRRLTLVNSTVSGNEVAPSAGQNPFAGGGIYNTGGLKLVDTTVSDNESDIGGGIFNSSIATDIVDIYRSTVSRNYARRGRGGGLHNQAGPKVPIYIENSTFSGNSAWDAFHGAAIANDGTVGLMHSTIHDNFSGLHAGPTGGFILVNTIIAENYSCTGPGLFGSQGRNLDSDNTCQLNPAIGDLPGVNPLLGPLQSNGGPTETHGLLFGSPAIDAVDPKFGQPIDQRGTVRPQGAGCDIGAYELVVRRTGSQ